MSRRPRIRVTYAPCRAHPEWRSGNLAHERARSHIRETTDLAGMVITCSPLLVKHNSGVYAYPYIDTL